MIRSWTLAALAALTLGTALEAQERVYHPLYLPASHNWTFRAEFPAADRLFNGFDYGHGVLYETLWARPDAPVELLEYETFEKLTRDVLRNPPRLPMPEASFMPEYARLVPLAKEMFEWAHVLHRQTYDILADRSLDEAARDRAMAELLEHYRASDLAFSTTPKGMAIMDEQPFSMEFRERYPRFNGLIWAYHWLQVGVYEPLLAYDQPEARQAAMQGALARFWQMVEGAPASLPSEMPMTPAVAPRFTERYPEFAAIFDNLHMMHDVISDVLASERVARGEKRAEIYRQADLFRDDVTMSVTRDAWIDMALAHGLDAQGGAAVEWLPEPPTTGVAGAGGHEGHEGHTDPGDQEAHADHADHAAADTAPGEGHAGDHGAMGGAMHGDGPGAMHAEMHPEMLDDALEAVRAFHRALATGDTAAAVSWLHPEVRVHEAGGTETLDEYRAHHLGADARFSAAVTRTIEEEAIEALGGRAVLYRATTRTVGRIGEREIDARGAETIVLVRTAEGWRLRDVHWSSR